ncbi:MAG TPA: TRAP transporter large permease subunit, partial [Dehalococcoidia bacterium]|nr:TRAP transporter large permease subunit [Dehalococcoidia bacterium]
NPSIAPPGPSLPRRERVVALARIWPVPLLAIIILGSIYFGIASITESAAMGAFGAVLMALYYRRFSFKAMRDASMAAARTTGFLMLIIVCAVFFGYFLAYLGVTPALSRFVANVGVSPLVALLIINLVFLVLGAVMDTASIVLVVIPIILPGLVGLGLDPIWLGVILAVNLEIGLITPPVGMNLYVMHGIAEKYGITFEDIFRGAAPFIVVDVIVIGLVIAFPELALWLPSQIR